MPVKRSYKKKSYKKKSYKKKGGYQNVNISRTPLPRKFCTKMRYSQAFTLSPGVTGIVGYNTFRLNSVYDPDYTGSGHQAMGFDQIMPLYDHCNVIGVKWKITGASSADAAAINRLGYIISDSPPGTYIAGHTWEALSENPEVRMINVGAKSGGNAIGTLYGKLNPNKFLGKTKGILNDDRLYHTIGSNPLETVYLGVFAAPMVTTQDTDSVFCTIELEYTVVFTEPRLLEQS